MKHVPTIVLETGTTSVRMSDIPTLMALAKYPVPQHQHTLHAIVKAYLGPNGEHDGRTQPLRTEDMKLLVEILGSPPEPGEVTTDEKWMSYIADWNTSPRRPSWTPGRQCIDAITDAALGRGDAEERYRKELIKAIRSGSLVALSHAGTPLDEGEREFLDLGHVTVNSFRDYAETVGIFVRVEIDGVLIDDLAESISQERTDRRPEKWKHSTDPDPLRRTIIAAIDKHGWPADGIPGVLPFIYAEIEVGTIEAFSVFDDIPCTDVSLVQANPAQWYVTHNAARYLLNAILRFVEGTYALEVKAEDAETLETNSVRSILYNNSDEPIWEEWAEYLKLTARQAVPLMHGLNPIFFASGNASMPPGRARKIPRAQELFRVCGHRIGAAEAADLTKLTPTEWFKWATEQNWPVSANFRAMTNPSAAKTSSNTSSTHKAPKPSVMPKPPPKLNRPDWGFWRHMPEVRLWQAVMLSFNTEPDTDYPDGGYDDFLKENPEAPKRLQLLRANLSNRQHFSAGTLNLAESSSHGVRLTEFAAWAADVVQWSNLPPELVAMARRPDATQTRDASAEPAPQSSNTNEPAWKAEARRIALVYIERHKAKDLHPAQPDVCRHVADEMRNANSYGPQGKPLTSAYIQRNAIQGEWWRKVTGARETRES